MNVLSRIRLALISCFGIGWLPASGTIVSGAAAVLIWKYPSFTEKLFSPAGFSLILPVFVLSTIAAALLIGTSEDKYRNRIAVDHLWGMVLAFAFVPASPKMVLLAFVLYRFIDIVKPWPVHLFSTMKNGIGSLLDDFASGLITGGLLYVITLAYRELMSYL